MAARYLLTLPFGRLAFLTPSLCLSEEAHRIKAELDKPHDFFLRASVSEALWLSGAESVTAPVRRRKGHELYGKGHTQVVAAVLHTIS